MNSMPACSWKALLTHFPASYTTHSSSHGRAFNRAETNSRCRRSGIVDLVDTAGGTQTGHIPDIHSGGKGTAHSPQGGGHDHRPNHSNKTTPDDLAEEDRAYRRRLLLAHFCLDPDPGSLRSGA